MATFRNDLPYLPSLRDGSPRAAQLRRRCGVCAGLLLFFFGMLAAAGLFQLIGILLLLLTAAGTAVFLRDRPRREWLSLRLVPIGERAALAASGLLGAVVAHGGSLRARGLRPAPHRAQRQMTSQPPELPVDPEAQTLEQPDVRESSEPSLTHHRRLTHAEGQPRLVRDVVAAVRVLPQRLPSSRRQLALGIRPSRPGTVERTAINDGDALRCQAFGTQLRRSGQPRRAIPLHQSARLIFAETGNRRGEALAMNGLGLALAADGDLDAALREFDQARSLLHALGDSEREGKVLVNVGLVKRQLGADEEATEMLRAAQARFAPNTYPCHLIEQHLQQAEPPRPTDPCSHPVGRAGAALPAPAIQTPTTEHGSKD